VIGVHRDRRLGRYGRGGSRGTGLKTCSTCPTSQATSAPIRADRARLAATHLLTFGACVRCTETERVEIDSSRGNPYGITKRAHSALTLDFVDEPDHPTHAALERVLSFLRERLLPP
jgi:hypothetical protein